MKVSPLRTTVRSPVDDRQGEHAGLEDKSYWEKTTARSTY
jgi:hypothetical protein